LKIFLVKNTLKFLLSSGLALVFCSLAFAADPPTQEVASNKDFGMGPSATPEMVAIANAAVTKKMPAGPFEPTWESVKANYHDPAWFKEA
jgi:hypothetical protein